MPTILLVDDDADLTAMLAEYLAAEGFAVRVAHDGVTGGSLALAPDCDLVVLDVMMPGGRNGIDTLREIRQSSAVPVLMLTARGDEIDKVVGLELGADHYVPKPCTPRELVARIRAILRRTARGVSSNADDGPINVRNLQGISLASDNVFRDDSAAQQLATVTGSVASGYVASLTVGVED